MKFAAADGRVIAADVPVDDFNAIRSDVCDILDLPHTSLFVNNGRIVTSLADVSGDVVVVADPNTSLMAQEVCAAVNRGANPCLTIATGLTRRIRLLCQMHNTRPLLAKGREGRLDTLKIRICQTDQSSTSALLAI